MQQIPVRDVMTPDPISITRDINIKAALEIMNTNDVRRLPVVSKTGRVIGVISKNDALLALPPEHGGLGMRTGMAPLVQEVMNDFVYTIGPDDPIAQAAQLMINHEISCLPVLDEDKNMIGIVTESDIFKFVAQRMWADAAG